MNQQQTTKEYSNYYNRALTKNKPELKNSQNSLKQKDFQSRQLSSNQFNSMKNNFSLKNNGSNQNPKQIADQDDVNPSPYITASQDDIFLKKQSLTINQMSMSKKKDSVSSQNNLKLKNNLHFLKPSSNSQNFETKSAGSQQPLLKFGGLKSSIQVQANQGQKFDFLDQTDTMRSSIHNNLSNDTSPKLANTQKLSSNLKNLKITENAQQMYMKTQQKKYDDAQKLSSRKPSSYQQAFQKQKQQTAEIQIPQINQEIKNQISRTVCSVQSTQSPIRKFQQFQEKQDKTMKKFGSVDCGQMIDYLHSQSVLQKPSNQTLINAQIQNYEIANKPCQNEAVKKLEYSKPLQNSQNNYIPTFQNNNSILQLKLQTSQNENQKRQQENTLQEIRSPLSVLSKRFPGSCLAGGATIQKLSKLEAKDQDEVNDVTEDENSEENQKTNNKIYSQDNQPSISINNLLSLQSAPVTNLQTQFNSPNQDFKDYVQNQKIKQEHVNQTQKDIQVQHQSNEDADSNLLDNENQKLRDEFIKVKQELEFLKKKQKFRHNITGISLPVSNRCAVTQLKSPKNGPFDQEIIQRTGKQGQVVLTFGSKNNYTEQCKQECSYRDEIPHNINISESQNYDYLKNQNSYNNIKMSEESNLNQNAFQSIDQFPDSIDLIDSQKLQNKIGNVTQRYDRQSHISQKMQQSDQKQKYNDMSLEQKQQNQQYQSIQTKKPPQHFVKTQNQDKSMRSKENIELDSRNNENQHKQNLKSQNSHLLKNKKEKQSNTIDYNNQNKNMNQLSRANSYNEVEVVDMTDEITSSHYQIMQLQQENDMLRTVSSRLQKNLKQNEDKKYQKSTLKTSQNQKLQSSQHKQSSMKQSYPKTQQQSIQEFKGSFQNKSIAHKNEKQESISIYGATIGDQNSSRRHFLNTCKKSFGSDGSKFSKNDKEVEYSASASNNSLNESNSSHSKDRQQIDDQQFNYKINSQYSQLASVRTKNRKRSVKNQGNISRTVVSSNAQKSNGAYQKIVESQRNYNEEFEQNHLLNSIDRINSKSKPIAHIDLLAQNTVKKKDIKQRNSSISCRNQSDVTSQEDQSDKKEHSFYKQNKSIQDVKQKVQQKIINDCQKQIAELQNQLKTLQMGQMPLIMSQNNLSQQNMNGQMLLTPRDQQHILLQQQLQAYQMYQHNIMNTVSSPHTLQFSQTPGAPLTPFTPLSNQNMMNQTSQFLQHQQPFLSNQNALNGVMQYNQPSAFEQYELQIQHLQNQIKEQQLQLQIQDHQNQVLQRNTISSPNDLFSQNQIQNYNDFQQNQFSLPQSDFNKNQAIFNNQEKSIQSRPGSVAKQNVSLNTLSAYQAHQSGLQRVSQSIKLNPAQIQSGIQYNDTQNQSNFFTQNTEFAKNIDDDHQNNQFDKQNNQYEGDSLTEQRSRNDYKNLHKTQEFLIQKKENNQYSDFEMVDIDDQENSLTKKIKQNNIGNSFDYMNDEYGKFEDEELRAGLKVEQNQQKKLKGTFAPSPDLLDQLRNFENSEMNKNQNFQTLKARDFDEKQPKNDSCEQISPDFKFSLNTDNNKSKANSKQLIIESQQKHDKKDTLLVIGFDEQPKGINPLNKKKFAQQKQKGPEEYITVRDIDRLSKIQRQSLIKSNNAKDQKENHEQFAQQNENEVPQVVMMEKKNRGELIIIQDDVPNFQEFAKLRRGKLGEHFQRQNNNKCISPQPRRSDIMRGDQKNQNLPPKSIIRFDKQDEDFQDLKKREEKSQQPKTKEELAEIRKKWMKTKFRDREDPKNPLSSIKMHNEENKQSQIIEINHFAKQRDVSTSQQIQESKNLDLMLRLASGQKAKVDEKAMKKLTHKNYEKLPEIIKKKAEMKKQQELEERKNKYASYQKELKERLRNEMIKKRSQIQPNQPKQSQGESQN